MGGLVLFDLDNTLVNRHDAFHRWLAEFAGRWGLGERDTAWTAVLDADGMTPRQEFFAALRERFGLPEPAEELLAAFHERMPELVVCPSEVLAGLGRLREAGWRLGIVTNGAAGNQEGKIRRSGLAAMVDGWAISGAEGVAKPDARLFRVAAERCGADLAGGGWMVGDDPVNDVVGGRSAGLTTIWVDRRVGPWPAAEPKPDRVVADAAGAIAVLLDR